MNKVLAGLGLYFAGTSVFSASTELSVERRTDSDEARIAENFIDWHQGALVDDIETRMSDVGRSIDQTLMLVYPDCSSFLYGLEPDEELKNSCAMSQKEIDSIRIDYENLAGEYSKLEDYIGGMFDESREIDDMFNRAQDVIIDNESIFVGDIIDRTRSNNQLGVYALQKREDGSFEEIRRKVDGYNPNRSLLPFLCGCILLSLSSSRVRRSLSRES